jgi:hypothetical protein
MKRWLLALGLAVAAVLAVIAVIEWNARTGDHVPSPMRATVSSSVGHSPVPVVVAGAEATRLGSRMQANQDIGNDVIFLIMATLRRRCHPALAHDLPRMAVIARLPLLSPDDGADLYSEDLRHDITYTVNEIAQRAACSQPLALRIGGYSGVLYPEAYARAFPESYFSPTLVETSREAQGASLEQRVADSCTVVVYAKLPLDDVHAWQCAALRRNARDAILRVCHTEGTSPAQAALDIQHLIDAMPVTCQ